VKYILIPQSITEPVQEGQTESSMPKYKSGTLTKTKIDLTEGQAHLPSCSYFFSYFPTLNSIRYPFSANSFRVTSQRSNVGVISTQFSLSHDG